MKTNLLPLLFYLFSFSATAQVGSLDPKFGNNGIQMFPIDPEEAAYAITVIPAADRSFFVVYTSFDDQVRVAKFSRIGVRDLSYGINGYSQPIPINFSEAALQEDGKLVLAGRTLATHHPDFHDDLMIVRLNTNGTFDQGFHEDGILTSTYTPFSYEFVNSLVIKDDRILVGGYSVSLVGQFASYHYDVFDLNGNAVSRVHLAFIDGLENYSPADYQYSFALQHDGVLVSSVNYDFATASYTSVVERFNIDGTPDDGFGEGGKIVVDDTFLQGPLLVTTWQDRVIVASYSQDAATGSYGFAVARFTATGAPDLSFNGTGKQFIEFYPVTPATPTAILVDNDKIYIGGNTVNPLSGKIEFALARLNADGTHDQSFSEDGKQITALSGYHLSLETMAVLGDRLAVSGKAATDPADPATFRAVTALYILNDFLPDTIACPADTTVSTAPGVCTAVVKGIDPVRTPGRDEQPITYALSGATNKSGIGNASGQSFNRGTTTVVYTLRDNPSVKCVFTVTVLDKEAPVVSNYSANRTTIWPPNHKMTDIELDYVAKDNCGMADTVISVRSNETSRGRHQEPGWRIINNRHIQLRAEKGKSPKNRVYTIETRVKDAAGNATVKSLEVRVANDQSQQLSKSHGIAEDETGLTVQVLNNPAMDQFTIVTSSDRSEPMSMRVVDAVGRVIEQKLKLTPNGQVQIGRAYRAGFYLAEFTQGEEKVVVRLIKQ